MKYKILESGNSSKHKQSKQLPMEYNTLETRNS